MIRLRLFLLTIIGLLSVVSLRAEDACNDYSRWWAYLVDEPSPTNELLENDTTYYVPSEFFTPDGAMIPDYTGSAYQTTGYYFRDTSCNTDDFELEARLLDVTGGGYHLVFGMSVEFEPEFDWEDYKDDSYQNAPRPMPMSKDGHKVEFSMTDADRPKSPLRLDAHIVVMGFTYHDGVLYFYRNGELYKEQEMDICQVQNFYVYWVYGGGGIESIRFQDNTNGTTYLENFTDCDNMQLIEECPPDPVVELRARYELPSCQDPTLRFYCESNVLEDFHWVAPDGTEFSTEQNPVLGDGFSAMSGTYYVWGKLHRCAQPTVVRLDLDIVPPEPMTDTVKVVTCSSDTLIIDGKVVTDDGFYREITRTNNGLCDSVTIYDVYVLHPKITRVELDLCEGDSVEFNGKFYKEAGIFTDQKKSQLFDCDSISYAIGVRMHERYFTERFDTICYGDTLDGFTETGVYADSLTTINGCDSVNVLHLFVLPEPKIDTVKIYSCSVGVTLENGTSVTENGIYSFVMPTADGRCDSTVVYDVEIIEKQTYDIDLEMCEGDSVLFNDISYKHGGTYSDVVKSVRADCDSIVYNINVTEHPSYFTARYDTICWGGSVDGFTETGVYADSLTTINGCDSVNVLHLFVLPEPKIDTIKIYSCSVGVTLENGTSVTENGIYSFVMPTADGRCDSTAVYDVEIIEKQTYDIDLEMCEGDSVLFNDISYKRGGTYTDIVKSVRADCDSIVYNINVTEHPSYFTARYDTICWGGSVDGFTETGVYADSLTTINGCDSIMQLNLYVYSKRDSIMENTRICEGDTLWIGDEPITEAGDYEINMGSVGKCDSFVVVRVDVDPTFSLSEPDDVYGCKRVEEQIEVDPIEGAQYQWQPVAYLSASDTYNPTVRTTIDVTYKVIVRRGMCVDSTSLAVHVSPGPLIENVDMSTEEQEVVINAVGGVPEYSYALNDGMWQSSSIFTGDIKVGASIAHVRDSFGCESSLPFYYLIPIYPEDHMTPNGDGIKDTWEIENLGLYKHYSVRIFDRYGKLLVVYRDYYPGWDGVYLGADMPATDYWYIISVDELDYEICGHFTLARFDR